MLTLIADGRTNKEVGDELKLAEKTVKNYVSSILSKLEVARRAEAAAYLARHHDAGLDRVIGSPSYPNDEVVDARVDFRPNDDWPFGRWRLPPDGLRSLHAGV